MSLKTPLSPKSPAPKTPRSAARKNAEDFARKASAVLINTPVITPDQRLSAYPSQLETNEYEVFVLSKIPGILEALQTQFGFQDWNVYNGNDIPERTEEDEKEAAATSVEEHGDIFSDGGDMKSPRGGLSPSASASNLTGDIRVNKPSPQEKLENAMTLLIRASDNPTIDPVTLAARERRKTRKYGLNAPFVSQVLVERNDSTITKFAFCVAEPDEKAVARAISQAHVVIGESYEIEKYIQNVKSLRWVLATDAALESCVRAVNKQKTVIGEIRSEKERVRNEFENTKTELIQKRDQMQAKFDAQSPLLAEALLRLKQLDKNELNNLRVLKNPNQSVQLCLKAVVLLLYKIDCAEWTEALKYVLGSNFKNYLSAFDPFTADPELIKKVETKFIKDENFAHDKMDRAYAIVGVLSRWLSAQVELANNSELLKPLVLDLRSTKLEIEQLINNIASMKFEESALVEELKTSLTRLGPVYGPHVSDYVISQIVSFERKLRDLHVQQQNSEWRVAATPYRLLKSLTVGVMGVGEIGRQVVQLLKAHGCKTKGLVRRAREEPIANVDQLHATEGKEGSELNAFLQDTDYIINILPSTAKTQNLLSGEVLKNAKPGAVLINVGRGDIIDSASLLAALDNNWLGGAVLDVVDQEPLPAESELWKKPNVVITSHVAGIASAIEVAAAFQENIKPFANGDNVIFALDLQEGY